MQIGINFIFYALTLERFDWRELGFKNPASGKENNFDAFSTNWAILDILNGK